MAKTYFITTSKREAKAELKKIFNKYIISDVARIEKWYRIEWISQKDFYKNSLESQREMTKYLTHLENMLEPESKKKVIKTDKEENDEYSEKQESSLAKAVSMK